MRHVLTLLQRLFDDGAGGDDHLTGAIDLSDSAYCFDLLNKHADVAEAYTVAEKCEETGAFNRIAL